MKSLWYGLLAIGLSTQLGCAHAQQAGINDAVTQESNAMSASSDEQIHTLQEYPELTPEGMGRRFLKYLDNLHTREQLTPEFLEQQMGITLTPEPRGAYFTMKFESSLRQYAVSFYQNTATPPEKSVTLWFSTGLSRDKVDMTPVCVMDFDAYRSELERMGYKDTGEDRYDHGPPAYDGSRAWTRLPLYFFERGHARVVVTVQGESEDNPRHLCVTEIEAGAWAAS